MKLRQAVGLIAAVTGVFLCLSAQAQVYYTDIVDAPGKEAVIRRTGPDGSDMTTLVMHLSSPRSIVLDTVGDKMYWNDLGLAAIRRANLDGSGAEFVVATGDSASGLGLDLTAGRVYWTGGFLDPRVRRANLDGTGVEDVVTSGLFNPGGIALDTVHGKLYWTDLEGALDGTGSIQRANLDGSNRETLLTNIDEAAGLACDIGGGKMYWTELRTKKIQRANLDGTGVEDVVTNLINPTTISLDLAARKMYWTDSDWFVPPPRIQKANLDGSNVETIVSGIGFPWGIAVVPSPYVSHRATATVQVVNGFVVGFTVTDPGYGYTNNPPPAVRIRDGSGVDATAHAFVENQQVVRLEIDSTGRGYSTNATVAIAPPPFSPTLKMEVLKVALEMSVVLGRKYQLEASTDLQTWTQVGPAFVAEADTIRQEFDVTTTGRFFRLNEAP